VTDGVVGAEEIETGELIQRPKVPGTAGHQQAERVASAGQNRRASNKARVRLRGGRAPRLLRRINKSSLKLQSTDRNGPQWHVDPMCFRSHMAVTKRDLTCVVSRQPESNSDRACVAARPLFIRRTAQNPGKAATHEYTTRRRSTA
jgi:hypothetical protein